MIAEKSNNMGGWNREENLSTISKKKEKDPWISRQESNTRRQESSCQKEKEGKEAARSLSSPFSFSKRERLKRKRDIERVLEAGRKLSNQYLVVMYHPNELDVSRLAIIVGRKFGKAHDRNRFKRYIREYFRLHKSSWKRCVDLVVLPRKKLSEEFESMGYREIERILNDLLGSLE
ncbi:MAG: ribonuclease protein component [Thermotogota bacterium]|nr:ribonuclease protein component [Thermotogota bacterium]MDK2864285.1 ribonuclease protein component [Thermotogota bacterium]